MRKKIRALFLCLVLNLIFLPGVSQALATEYDLIVVGGEPEGIAAALAAARQGLQTLLIEEGEILGGLMTLGGLNFLDMNYGPQGELLTQGIFAEFYRDLGNAFDLQEAAQYFADLVQKESNLTLKLATVVQKPLLEEQKLVGLQVQERGQEKKYYGTCLIDATVDADLAAASGVPYTVGAEDYGHPERMMGVTLIFRVEKVNWFSVFLYNNFMRFLSKLNARWGDPYAGANWQVAWGYGEQALQYQAKDPLLRFRGPNLARQKDGTVLVNALLLFGVDSLDPLARQAAIERGRAEIPHIISFMRKNFPGFARVQFVDTAERLYVRETRHMQGEYRLTITDVLENRDHEDRLAWGSYPVDLQPFGPDDLGNVVGKPDLYSIPLRCLVPLEVENLLVVGRSASYDSLAHGSARVLPVGMVLGEAAGVVATYAVRENISVREMTQNKQAVQWVQEKLKEEGAFVAVGTIPRPQVMDHWAYPGLKVMRELGLAAGGYHNDYQLDHLINYWDVETIWQEVTAGQVAYLFPQEIRCGLLAQAAVWALEGQEMGAAEAGDFLVEQGYLEPVNRQYFSEEARPTFGQLYLWGTLLKQAREVKGIE